MADEASLSATALSTGTTRPRSARCAQRQDAVWSSCAPCWRGRSRRRRWRSSSACTSSRSSRAGWSSLSRPPNSISTPTASCTAASRRSICDTACGCAVISELPPGETCATLEIKVNYLRPVGVAYRPASTASERCSTSAGARRSPEARLVDPRGKLVAHATSTLMTLSRRGPAWLPLWLKAGRSRIEREMTDRPFREGGS